MIATVEEQPDGTEDDVADLPEADAPEADGPEAPVGLADLVLAATALLLLIANGPQLNRGSPVLLTGVVWPLGAVGFTSLGLLAWRGDRASRWAAGYLGWALVATAFSAQPRLSFDAGYGADRGWVFLAAYLGCWAVGRRRGAQSVRLVTGAILVGLALNVVLALLQAVTDGSGLLQLPDGRAMGFTMSSVYLGGLMSGALAFTCALSGRSPQRWWAWLPAVAIASTAANMAGSRVGVLGGAALGLLAVRRTGLVRVVAVAAAIGLGLLLASPILSNSGTSRLTSSESTGSGIGSRSHMWRAGLTAASERPVVGWGPNRFCPATNWAADADFIRTEGAEKLFFDAHNIFIEHLVTTGIPGLVLLTGFGVVAARRARGPLAWYAAGVAITWLLEPAAIATVPTALLALGLACVDRGPTVAPDPPPAPTSRRIAFVAVTVVLALVGFGFGARSVWVDHLIFEGPTELDTSRDFVRAVDLMPRDAALHDIQTQGLAAAYFEHPSPELKAAVVRSAREAVHLDPTYSRLWVSLGRVETAYGPGPLSERLDRARAAYEEALRHSPWSTAALSGLFQIDMLQGRVDHGALVYAQLCAVDACPYAAR